MSKYLTWFLVGAASIFDLDASFALNRARRARDRMIDPKTNVIRISKEAAPSEAFYAVGKHLRHSIESYEKQTTGLDK